MKKILLLLSLGLSSPILFGQTYEEKIEMIKSIDFEIEKIKKSIIEEIKDSKELQQYYTSYLMLSEKNKEYILKDYQAGSSYIFSVKNYEFQIYKSFLEILKSPNL